MIGNLSKRLSPIRYGFLALIIVFVAVLSACNESPAFSGSDITAGDIGQGWVLTDADGRSVTNETFAGKVIVVFFGFTQCPDICPAALSEIHNALSLLGDQAKDVQVLMVSVDPERDTPEIMQSYLKAFSDGLPAHFLGLTGNPEQLKQTAKAFRAFYAKVKSANGSYTMDHSAGFYLLDKAGKARVLLNSQAGPEAMANDIKLLLQ